MLDEALILTLVKARLGITTAVRDSYLEAIVKGVITELQDEKGVALTAGDYCQMMFIVDYSVWRYQSRDSDGSMPRHLAFRMHNLFVHAGGADK